MTKELYHIVKYNAKLSTDYFPETLYKMYIINAPFFFTAVWKIVSAWLDEATRKKVKIYGNNYEKDLFNEIDKTNLPKFLNG